LQQRVGRRPRLRLRRRGPVTEGEEADVFHGGPNGDRKEPAESIHLQGALRSIARKCQEWQ
jgi:hypothetical protein